MCEGLVGFLGWVRFWVLPVVLVEAEAVPLAAYYVLEMVGWS